MCLLASFSKETRKIENIYLSELLLGSLSSQFSVKPFVENRFSISFCIKIIFLLRIFHFVRNVDDTVII